MKFQNSHDRLPGKTAVEHLEAGRRVEAGDILFKIDPADFQLSLDDILAQEKKIRQTIKNLTHQYELDKKRLQEVERHTHLSRSRYERYYSLNQTDHIVSNEQVEAAEIELIAAKIAENELKKSLELYPGEIRIETFRLESLKTTLSQIRLDLERCSVQAPFSGRVESSQVELGMGIEKRIAVAMLCDETTLELHVPLSARDTSLLSGSPNPDEIYGFKCLIIWNESDTPVRLNGSRSTGLSGATKRPEAEEDAIEISDAVNNYIIHKQKQLDAGMHFGTLHDADITTRNRIDTLMKNGLFGLVLVLIVLWIFIDKRLAFWVAAGIPFSISGGLVILWLNSGTLNMVSLFSLIMVLGIIADDAIVVGEAILHHRKSRANPLDAVILGVKEVGMPVFLAVATSVIAFLPLLFIPGMMGGLLPFDLFPENHGSVMTATVEFPVGTSIEVTRKAVETLDNTLDQAIYRDIRSALSPRQEVATARSRY